MAFGVNVDFNANIGQFLNDADRLNRRLGEIDSNLTGLRDAGISAFRFLAAGVTTAGIITFGKSVIDTADDLNDLSLKTGITVEKLSGLNLAANQSGTDLDSVASAVNKLSKNIGGNADEFAKLGITAKDPLAAFEQLADLFVSIEDPQQRAAVAAQVLGKSWEEVAPLLSLGGRELAKIIEKGSAASGMTTELAQASDQLNDTLAELQVNSRGLAVKGFAPLVPILNDLIDFFDRTDEKTNELDKDSDKLRTTYVLIAKGVAAFATTVQIAATGIGALAAKIEAIAEGNFKGLNVIDEAFKESVDQMTARYVKFTEELDKPQTIELQTNFNANNTGGADGKIDLSGSSTGAVQQLEKNNEKTQEKIKESFEALQSILKTNLSGIKGNIDEEVGLFDYRNKKLEASLDLGLISQEDYFREKERLQKEQLAETEALLDQEINALKQFQAQATDEAAKSGAQEQINELIRKKTELERDSQIATLENAAAAKQALGDYASGLIDINGLLEGVTSNIIGMSKAQADVNFKKPGEKLTQEDLANPNTIFQNAEGTSFSDNPSLKFNFDFSQKSVEEFQQKVADVENQVSTQTAITVSVDDAPAIDKINNIAAQINQRQSEIKAIAINTEVNQQSAIDGAKQARDAAQANVQPVVIPVVYQAQNSPATAAPIGDLRQTALANGGR